MYISEISSSKLRGLFGILLTGSTLLGVTFTFGLSSIDGFFYYYISLVAVGIVAMFEVFMFWLPETPRSLMSRGYVNEARKVLIWLRGPDYKMGNLMKSKNLLLHQRKLKSNRGKSFSKRIL